MGALQELPDHVTGLLQPLPAELEGKCVNAGPVRVVMVPGLFHMNVYHMMLYFVRYIVQGVLQAWGPQAFEELAYILINHPHQGSMPGNLVYFRIAEVFLPGGDVIDNMKLAGHACMHFDEVLLMQEGPFWSGPGDTQSDGFEQGLERRSYSLIRQLYRQKLVPEVSSAAGKADPVRVLYLGRAQTDARHVLNEAGLLESLELAIGRIPGVEMQVALNFESISFEEQVRQSASADILIGPHGAGLTHVLFMRPHSVLIELLPHAWADPGYRTLSHYTGSVYMHWQQTEEALSEEMLTVGNTTRSTGRSNSFHVDVEAVVGLLRAAVNIAYMVGERYWPPCPGYEIINYERGVPIDCPELWVRDEGVKSPTPPTLMPDTFDLRSVQQQGQDNSSDAHADGNDVSTE